MEAVCDLVSDINYLLPLPTDAHLQNNNKESIFNHWKLNTSNTEKEEITMHNEDHNTYVEARSMR